MIETTVVTGGTGGGTGGGLGGGQLPEGFEPPEGFQPGGARVAP